jgi:hypothetical protein
VVPDIMTMAKGLTSGYVPAGAVVLREPLAQALEKRYLPLGAPSRRTRWPAPPPWPAWRSTRNAA